MTNYAVISEAITKKLIKANERVDHYENLTNKSMEYVNKCEADFSIPIEECKKAYDKHKQLMDKYESALYIRDQLREARDAYCKAMRHIDYANSEMMFACFVDE